MKKFTNVLLLVAIALIISGCALSVNPLVGALYADVEGPLAVTGNSPGALVGESKASLIFGVSFGDASVKSAAANGGITKIKTVDQKVRNVLGVFMEVTTIVTGDD
ncbi:TRL-like family protein [Candidatus Uabimicrobium sp. HlEnr_7]|uniref:TRL-like family protein n=1 Tax=Candidatus Uabimicrobium helgolandensis TaxID=3095367 RepID=UPI00355700EE